MDRSKWEYKKLGDISFYPRKRLEKELLSVGNYVGVENLLKDKKGRIDSEDLPANNTSTIEYMPNDILIGNIRPYLRKIWLADKKGGASGDVIVVRINEDYRKNLFPNYLYLVLSDNSFFDYDMAHSKGAKMPRGDKDAVLKYTIPIPSYEDQQRIVAELDCLNEMIAVKQEQLKEFDKLAQSIFYDMFGDPVSNDKGWSLTTLGEHFAFSQGLQVPTDLQYLEEGKNRKRFLRIIDFTQGNEPARYIEEDSDKYYLLTNEIAIVRYGTPGFVCMGKEGVIANNLFKITSQYNDVNNWFLYFYLNSDAFQKPIRANQYGATMKAISFGSIKKIPFILPPLSLQQQFADKISAIEAQKELVKQSIAETQKLLDYTMDYYFNE